MINQLERIGKVEVAEDGTRSIESETLSWQVAPDNTVKILDKESGAQITPTNLNQGQLDTIKTFAAIAESRGLLQPQVQSETQGSPTQSQSQSQSQATVAQAPDQPKQVQSERQTQALSV